MGSFFDLTLQNKNLDAKIAAGLERLSSAFRVLLWEQAKEYGLSPIQIQILIFLKYHNQKFLNVSYLAKEMNVTKPTVSDAVRVLEQKSLIKKTADSIDTRSYSIQLTAAGKRMVEKTESYASSVQQLISKIKLSNKELIWDALSSLIFELNRSNILTVQRTCFNCSFFKKGIPHQCSLLNIPLQASDIRLDCPEFADMTTH
ncbi:MAG: winged helix-turn-helix transcriptional regulator [Bacteroidetes bacterium]|nr:winged helix-turn-helix transcriptional regulator [Bacteroidota bacterium]